MRDESRAAPTLLPMASYAARGCGNAVSGWTCGAVGIRTTLDVPRRDDAGAVVGAEAAGLGADVDAFSVPAEKPSISTGSPSAGSDRGRSLASNSAASPGPIVMSC